MQTGTLDPHILSALISGATTGRFSAEDKVWFADRGPAGLVARIRVPTLLVQGTADTLFTPSEAIRNHELLARSGVPLKMIWFCGGHGICLTGEGDAGKVERVVLAWLRRHVAGDPSVDTGPGFERVADDAVWRSADRLPPPAGAPIVARGSGTLDSRRPTRCRRALEGSRRVPARRRAYVLQLVGGTTTYGPTRNAGLVTFSSVRLELPTSRP